MKLNYARTFVLGFGFLSITMTWSLYNAFVPIFLDSIFADMALKGLLIGAIMTLDNIAAVTLQPHFGAASDRTWTRYGRRMPYLLVGMPLAAVFFAAIPFFRISLVPLIAVVFAMNLAMAVFRAPTVALMPDITPPVHRSKANGIINLMGGIGALLAYFVGSQLYKAHPSLPFVWASATMLAVIVLLRRLVVESESVHGREQGGRAVGILRALGQVVTSRDRSPLYMLLAVYFWFLGWTAIEAFFTLYAKSMWGLTEASGAFYLGFFSLSFVVFALPAGIVSGTLGRRRTIALGVAGLTLVLMTLSLVGMDNAGTPVLSVLERMTFGIISLQAFVRLSNIILAKLGIILPVVLGIGGLFWALININSYPMVVDMADKANTGAYTGLYYLFSSLAAITGPPLFGLLRDTIGMKVMFPFAMIATLAALSCLLKVRSGEVPETAVYEVAG